VGLVTVLEYGLVVTGQTSSLPFPTTSLTPRPTAGQLGGGGHVRGWQMVPQGMHGVQFKEDVKTWSVPRFQLPRLL